MHCELKNVKVHEDMSEETTCFSATLWIDGRKAADLRNDGRGGSTMMHFANRALAERFNAFCKALPPVPSEFGELPMDADFYVSQLLDQYERQKWLKRQTRTKVLFRINGDKPEDWRTIKAPNADATRRRVRKQIEDKYGDKVLEIQGA